ncbi:MAG TPA: formyltransferase family protein [Euzebyales bacterium]|nr:formyltransferase family protein [Euzebyales bacterium]
MRVVVVSTCDAIGSYVIEQVTAVWPETAVVRPTWDPSDRTVAHAVRACARAPARSLRRGYLGWRSSRCERELVRLLFPGGRKPAVRFAKVPSRLLNEDRGVALLRSLEPEVLVLCGSPILKRPVLAVPAKATVNLHFGIAPEYRGEDAVLHALRRNDSAHVGVTLHHVDLGVDTGRLLATGGPTLDRGDDEAVALARCAKLAATLLQEYLAAVAHGDVPGVAQPPGGRTYRSADRRAWHDLQLWLNRRMGRTPAQPGARISRYVDVPGQRGVAVAPAPIESDRR